MAPCKPTNLSTKNVNQFTLAVMSRIGSAHCAVVACLVLASSAALAQSPSLDSRGEPALSPEQKATLARHDELQTAIVKQDAARVGAMIRAGMPLDFNFDETTRGRTSQSPLTVAISLDRFTIASYCLLVAHSRRLDGFGEAAVHYVKSLEAVQLLKKHGADINAQNRRGMTALAQAVERTWQGWNCSSPAVQGPMLRSKARTSSPSP
jgi:hypothetical protein